MIPSFFASQNGRARTNPRLPTKGKGKTTKKTPIDKDYIGANAARVHVCLDGFIHPHGYDLVYMDGFQKAL